jgi:hypothetical protein
VSSCLALNGGARLLCRQRVPAPPVAELPRPRVFAKQGRSSERSSTSRVRRNARGVCVARWYDPGTGEFMSVDPDLAETDQPYAYASDDPVNEGDPSGDSVELCLQLASFVQPEVPPVLEPVGGGGGAPQSPTPPTLTANSTPTQWSSAILSGLGFANGRYDIFAVDGWEEAEHSTDWYDDPDTNNPLDTSLICCHGVTENSSGVKAYPTPADGLRATILTLQLPPYFAPLKNVFRKSDSDPGDALADLLATPTFVNAWTSNDSGWERGEYDHEVSTGVPWSGLPG